MKLNLELITNSKLKENGFNNSLVNQDKKPDNSFLDILKENNIKGNLESSFVQPSNLYNTNVSKESIENKSLVSDKTLTNEIKRETKDNEKQADSKENKKSSENVLFAEGNLANSNVKFIFRNKEKGILHNNVINKKKNVYSFDQSSDLADKLINELSKSKISKKKQVKSTANEEAQPVNLKTVKKTAEKSKITPINVAVTEDIKNVNKDDKKVSTKKDRVNTKESNSVDANNLIDKNTNLSENKKVKEIKKDVNQGLERVQPNTENTTVQSKTKKIVSEQIVQNQNNNSAPNNSNNNSVLSQFNSLDVSNVTKNYHNNIVKLNQMDFSNHLTSQVNDMSHDIINQVVKNMNVTVRPGNTDAEITLKPEFLGRIKMKISLEDGTLSGNIIVEKVAVKEIIETNLEQLQTELNKSGVNIGQLNIELSNYQSHSTNEDAEAEKISLMNNIKKDIKDLDGNNIEQLLTAQDDANKLPEWLAQKINVSI